MSGRPAPSSAAISVREIELQLRGRCEQLVRELLPNAVQDGHYLRIGSIAGERGQSLAVTLAGPNRGMWTDFSATAGTGEAGGDMIGMIEQVRFGGDRGKAVQWAKSWLGLDHLDPARLASVRREAAARDAAAEAKAAREAEAKKRGALALWLDGKALDGSDPASRYLAARGIVAADGHWPGSLRYHPEVWNRDAGAKLPAMLATLVTPDGVASATHRTWLARGADGRWGKADGGNVGVPRGSAKKVLGKAGGAFVPIAKGASGKSMGALTAAAGETVYATEGVEDALTVAMVRPAFRVIAAYSLRNLGAIVFPAGVARLVICADRDEGGAEQAALEVAIARQQTRGVAVELVMPPVGVKDLNGWLTGGALGVAA